MNTMFDPPMPKYVNQQKLIQHYAERMEEITTANNSTNKDATKRSHQYHAQYLRFKKDQANYRPRQRIF